MPAAMNILRGVIIRRGTLQTPAGAAFRGTARTAPFSMAGARPWRARLGNYKQETMPWRPSADERQHPAHDESLLCPAVL